MLELAGASSGCMRLSDHAARSMSSLAGLSARVCHPSTLRMVICPDASRAQNSMAAVSAQGSTVWVLIRRLNSSCNRSIVFEVRIDFHWLGGSRVNVNSLSPASSRLSATARHLRRHERLAPGLDLAARGGIDHVAVVVRNFLVQALR